MGRMKQSKKKAPPTPDSSSHEIETDSNGVIREVAKEGKRTKE